MNLVENPSDILWGIQDLFLFIYIYIYIYIYIQIYILRTHDATPPHIDAFPGVPGFPPLIGVFLRRDTAALNLNIFVTKQQLLFKVA